MKPRSVNQFVDHLQKRAHYTFVRTAEGNRIARAQFEQSVAQKMKHAAFLSDVPPLLRPGVAYDAAEACSSVERELLGRLGPAGKGRQ